MQTATTQRTVKARTKAHKAAAPFSASAAKLIEQLQAEAREQLLVELSAKDAITVLHGFDRATKTVSCYGGSISIGDAKGNTFRFSRRYQIPESWLDQPHMFGAFHPAHWSLTRVFIDGNGQEWMSYTDHLVCDDFGNLVQVAA